MVERIIEEVFKIPDLFDHSGVPSQPQRINLPQFDPKKYEELLATAVLNKVRNALVFAYRMVIGMNGYASVIVKLLFLFVICPRS